jgi:DNA-binding transcriptional LysR family regulator
MDRADRVSRRLKLRQLEVLLAVANSGSMAKAAELLAITQPVISKSIADLEQTLGMRLFDRTSQGVEPTLYGHALLLRSVAIFNDLRTSVSELDSLSDPTAGDLRIGSSETIAAGLLGIIINRLSQAHPRLTFEVFLGGDLTDLPHRDLRARSIDLIIGRLPKAIPDDMDAITLCQDQLLVVAGMKHPLVGRRKLELADLLAEPWCGAPFDSFPWTLVRDAFQAKGLKVPSNVVRTRSILTRNALLATGRFVTILPRSMLYFAAENFALKRVPVELSAPKYPVGVLALKNRILPPAAQLFISTAREVIRPFSAR